MRVSTGAVEKYRLRTVPTFILLIDGKEVRRRSGGLSKDQIRNMFRKPLF